MVTIAADRRTRLAAVWLIAVGLTVLIGSAVVSGARGLAIAICSAGVGAGAAVATARRSAAVREAEEARLNDLVDRRAEQVAALSHELRTPLTMIKGSVDLLLEGTPGPITAAQERFLTVIHHQCAHVVALCESVLIQAKIEAGLFTPRLEKTDISVIARDVVTAMRTICAQREQRISLDTPQVARRIPADPTLIAQALTNLVSNASRFTTVGGNVHVRVAAIDTGICVYVTDDGAGMNREQRQRLFQRFATGQPLSDGTGLGLVITKTIVEMHG